MRGNKIFIFIAACLLSQSGQAQMAVQRSAGSSYFEYQKYLSQTKAKSFVRSYLDLSKTMILETGLLNQCLEDLFVGRNSEDICFDAIKNLNAQPLNDISREVVFSFIKKLAKFPSKHINTYKEFEKGFSVTHPELVRRFGALKKRDVGSQFSKLEMKAWQSWIGKKILLTESLLLINGEIVKDLNSWQPPSGVYQWALISNTHEPIIRVSSFSQFAAESIRELKAFSNQTCEESKNRDIKNYGLKNLQIFYSRRCVLEKNLLAMHSEPGHLGEPAMKVKMISPSSKTHWIFPALAILGLGLASQLKGKEVSLTMPGF